VAIEDWIACTSGGRYTCLGINN